MTYFYFCKAFFSFISELKMGKRGRKKLDPKVKVRRTDCRAVVRKVVKFKKDICKIKKATRKSQKTKVSNRTGEASAKPRGRPRLSDDEKENRADIRYAANKAEKLRKLQLKMDQHSMFLLSFVDDDFGELPWAQKALSKLGSWPVFVEETTRLWLHLT